MLFVFEIHRYLKQLCCQLRSKSELYIFEALFRLLKQFSYHVFAGVKKLGRVRLLQKLNASENNIKTFLKLKPIPTALRNVDFSNNRIQDLVSLRKFWALTTIDLSRKYEYEELFILSRSVGKLCL